MGLSYHEFTLSLTSLLSQRSAEIGRLILCSPSYLGVWPVSPHILLRIAESLAILECHNTEYVVYHKSYSSFSHNPSFAN
jgi:hypothetical protein